MTDYKLVPFEPTPEMIEAAEEAHMPFGDMDIALRMAILAAPVVQGEPVAYLRKDQLPDFATYPDDSDEGASLWCHGFKRGWNSCLEAVAKTMQPAEQKPECGCCGQTDRCDDDCDAVVIGGHRAAEQQHHRDSAELRRLCKARDEQRDGRLAALERAAKAEADVAGLVEALKSLVKGYVNLLEAGRDRITSLGGDCDPVSVMEHSDPWLRDARAVLDAYRKGGDAP